MPDVPEAIGEKSEATTAETDADPVDDKVRASAKVARLLDECFRIPGTKIRFGLDPILGLIPGGGETAASAIGAYIVADATRNGIPFRLLLKMAGNMLLNGIIGVIPGIGDLFSVWFKSNARNYRMMREHMDSADGEAGKGGWWPLIAVAALLGTVFFLIIAAWFLVWGTVVNAIFRAT